MNKGYVIVDYTTGVVMGPFASWIEAYEWCANLENHKIMIDTIN